MKIKLGTTSYIYPGEILFNVEKLKSKVDDIELLMFEYEGSLCITDNEITKLKNISVKHNLTYTVHLPTDTEGNDTIKKLNNIIKIARPLDPYAYILHIETKNKNWENDADNLMKGIVKVHNFSSRNICVENLEYPLELLDNLIEKYDISVCLDLGHLLLYGHDVKKYFRKYIDKARVIHLCGVDKTGRHLSLKHADSSTTRWVCKFLNSVNYEGIVTLEIFSESDFIESKNIWDEFTKKSEPLKKKEVRQY